MSGFTKSEIKRSFIKLLDERPLASITVKDIVDDCKINRSSFYYHYSDISAILEEIIRERTDEILRKYPTIDSEEQCLDAMLDFVLQNRRATLHIYRSSGRELFERRLAEACEYFVRAYADSAFASLPLNLSQKNAAVQYYKYLLLGFTLDWLEHGLDAQMAEAFREIMVQKGQQDLAFFKER